MSNFHGLKGRYIYSLEIVTGIKKKKWWKNWSFSISSSYWKFILHGTNKREFQWLKWLWKTQEYQKCSSFLLASNCSLTPNLLRNVSDPLFPLNLLRMYIFQTGFLGKLWFLVLKLHSLGISNRQWTNLMVKCTDGFLYGCYWGKLVPS